ncbi:MAG: VWA domain-containing protein [Lachnospiraceae bacterium]|nr:VWA domain-containing protein [Lachnospiraceae bacterium]
MGDALKKASSILTGAEYDNKYVLFFTDGMPGYNSGNNSFNCMVANSAVNYANTIKNDQNTKIYTIGYYLSGSFNWTKGHSATSQNGHENHNNTTTATNFLSNYIATDVNHAYTTSDSSGLNQIFKDIAGQLGDPYVINADRIVDVIDSRFELTAKSEAALKEKYGADLTIKKNNDGTTTLTWAGDSAKIGNKLNGNAEGWTAEFEVQAKADFVGGNVIPTNGSTSGIYYKDATTAKEQMFPQPSVNVKLLTPEVGNDEVTVKVGDNVLSSMFPGKLTPTFDVIELDNTTKLTYEDLEITSLTDAELATLNNGGTVTRDYKYPGTDDVIGQFTFSYAPSSETPTASVADHKASVIGNRAEVYELTATYVPKTVDARNEQLSDDIKAPDNGGKETTAVSGKGAYVVNVEDPTGGTENKKLESDKNASVKDEAQRIFKIDLTAHTTGREEGSDAKGASIVLVLDKSGSMNSSGKTFKDIQDAAKAFVDEAAKESPLSEIAVVWYSGSEGNNTMNSNTSTYNNGAFTQLNTTQKINGINDYITKGVSASGGTPMGDALHKANDILSSAQNDAKYVLLFTDGMPGYQSNNDGSVSWDSEKWNCQVANNAVNYANQIKAKAEIYTVGYGLSDNDKFTWNPGDSATSADNGGHGYYSNWAYNSNHTTITTGKNFLANYIATDTAHAYETSNAGDLSAIFEDLAGKMGNPYSIQAEKIVDVIDSRFKITADSAAALKQKYGDELSIVENEDGTTTLTWTGQSAKIMNVIDGGWSVNFEVQAKADFVGGNAIPTNGASSGIYVEGTTPKYFPQPSVNVKLLTPEVGDNEVTLYKGETIESSGFPGDLAETFDVLELDNTTKLSYEELGIDELTSAEIARLNAGETVNRDYAYPGTTDVVGHFEFIYAPTTTPGGNVSDHEATTVGDRVEIYELTVKFVPNTVVTRVEQLPENVKEPDPSTAIGGTPVTELSDKGEYVVNVLDRWYVIKQSSSTDDEGQHPLLAGAEFKLTPSATNTEITQTTYYGKSDDYGILQWYSDSGFLTQIRLSDITYDTYILEETKAPAGYAVSTIKWTVTITETGTTITANNTAVTSTTINNDYASGTAYYYENTPIYNLPNSGGSGIFWYLIGGVLLMMAAALILYRKNVYGEVLKR